MKIFESLEANNKMLASTTKMVKNKVRKWI